jgi:hypothetical protein
MKYFLAWWTHLNWADALILTGCLAIAIALLICIVIKLHERDIKILIHDASVDRAYRTHMFSVGRDVKRL